MRKVIGLDCDGVIIDHTELKIEVAKMFNIELKPEETPSEILKKKLPQDVYKKLQFLIYDDPKVASSSKLMSGAEDGLGFLRSKGIAYYLISRRKNAEWARELLAILGLWGKYFNFNNTFFVEKDEDKDDVAKQLGIEVYMDDQIKILRLLNSGVREKYLLDPLGVHEDADWYQRVRIWPEFLQKIGL